MYLPLTVEQSVPVSHVESEQDDISPIRTIHRNEMSSRHSLSPHNTQTLREQSRMIAGEFQPSNNYKIFQEKNRLDVNRFNYIQLNHVRCK